MLRNDKGEIRLLFKIVFAFLTFELIFSVVSFMVANSIVLLTKSAGGVENMTSKSQELVLYIVDILPLIVQSFVIIGTTILLWKVFEKTSISNIGITRLKNNVKNLIIGIAIGIVMISIVCVVILASKNGEFTGGILKPNMSKDIIVYMFVFILIAISEEIMFRGYIISLSKPRIGIKFAIILSAVFFGYMHNKNPGFSIVSCINIIILGILLAIMFAKTENLWMPIGFHFAWNYFQGIVYGFKVSGLNTEGMYKVVYNENNLVNGGKFGPEGGVVVTVVGIVAIVIFLAYYKRRDLSKQEAE